MKPIDIEVLLEDEGSRRSSTGRSVNASAPQWTLELDLSAGLSDPDGSDLPSYREIPLDNNDHLPKRAALKTGSKPWLQYGSGPALPARLGGKGFLSG